MQQLELNDILSKIVPILLTFVLGFFLKKRRLFTSEHAEIFLKLVFYIALPPLILLSVVHTRLSLNLIYLPLICAIVTLVTLPIVHTTGRSFHLPDPSLGVFIVGPMIINTTFVLPFLLSVYGPEAIARLSIFDVGNNIMIYTVAYYCANRYGTTQGSKSMLKIIARSPLLYALVVGLILNVAKVPLSPVCLSFLHLLSDTVTPLVMLSLGIYFSPTVIKAGPTFVSIVLRIVMGFLLALLLVFLFRVEGLNRAVVLIACSAPLGFTTLAFAAITGLDTEFAASSVSYSIVIGLLTTPILLFFLSHWA